MIHTRNDETYKILRLSVPFSKLGKYKPINQNGLKRKRRANDFSGLSLEVRSLRRSKARLESERNSLKESIEKLRFASTHDHMTGLLNRHGLELAYDRLAHARSSKLSEKGHVLVFLDGDGFGQINKIYRDDVGDQVINEISKSLKKYTRKTDIITRKGGDEFVVIFRHVTERDMQRLIFGPRGLQERLNHNTRISLDHVTLLVTCSIGMTHFTGTENLGDVLRAADADMRSHKQMRKAIAQK